MDKRFLLIAYVSTLAAALALLAAVFEGMGPGGQAPPPAVAEYRATRILLAILAGGVLASTGAFLQSTLRNPLVDHYILGVGGGAVFASYIYYIAADMGVVDRGSIWWQILFASAGGLTALAITILVAEYVGGSDTAYVLAGIGVSSAFSGAALVLSYFVLPRHPYAVHALVGSLVLASRKWVPALSILLALSVVAYLATAKPLNAMYFGDEYALQLGYNPRAVRLGLVVFSGVASSVVVACCGMIGFLGLVTPHTARLMLRTSDNRVVTPVAMLLGSLILLVADNVSRIALSTSMGEVPVGALTSLIGAPFYIAILARRLRGR